MNKKMRETEMRLKIRARKPVWLLEADGSLVYLELTALPPTQKHHLQAACSLTGLLHESVMHSSTLPCKQIYEDKLSPQFI